MLFWLITFLLKKAFQKQNFLLRYIQTIEYIVFFWSESYYYQ